MKSLKAACRFLWSIATCVLASSGFRVDTLGWWSGATLTLAIGGYCFHELWVGSEAGAGTVRVYAYFASLFALRYVYLFASFVRGGIADRLIARFGETRGYRLYEIGTAWMFFQRGLTFAPLIALHPWSLLSLWSIDGASRAALQTVCVGVGFVLLVLGFVVNTASTLVVGFDVYYYKDLFLRRALCKFETRGPYRYLSNPMYGVGQCSGYGAALMLGSVEGLLATLINQICMYVFYYAIERPHIAAVFATRPSPGYGFEEAVVASGVAPTEKRAAIAALLGIALLVPSRARGAQNDPSERPLATYSAIGVGAIAEGVAHVDAGAIRLDIGLGESTVGVAYWRRIVGQVGYQYGSNLFLGLTGRNWSARVGVNPHGGAWRMGGGYGAPLLPLPSVITAAAARSYPRVEHALVDATLLDAILAVLGPVTDAVASGSTCSLGVGIQAGFEPAGVGLYGFAGVAAPL
jgi:hypothetical protein